MTQLYGCTSEVLRDIRQQADSLRLNIFGPVEAWEHHGGDTDWLRTAVTSENAEQWFADAVASADLYAQLRTNWTLEWEAVAHLNWVAEADLDSLEFAWHLFGHPDEFITRLASRPSELSYYTVERLRSRLDFDDLVAHADALLGQAGAGQRVAPWLLDWALEREDMLLDIASRENTYRIDSWWHLSARMALVAYHGHEAKLAADYVTAIAESDYPKLASAPKGPVLAQLVRLGHRELVEEALGVMSVGTSDLFDAVSLQTMVSDSSRSDEGLAELLELEGRKRTSSSTKEQLRSGQGIAGVLAWQVATEAEKSEAAEKVAPEAQAAWTNFEQASLNMSIARARGQQLPDRVPGTAEQARILVRGISASRPMAHPEGVSTVLEWAHELDMVSEVAMLLPALDVQGFLKHLARRLSKGGDKAAVSRGEQEFLQVLTPLLEDSGAFDSIVNEDPLVQFGAAVLTAQALNA